MGTVWKSESEERERGGGGGGRAKGGGGEEKGERATAVGPQSKSD